MTDHIHQIVQQLIGLLPEIDDRKLDFLLGQIQTGPAAAKSAQRGYDFVHRLGYDQVQLRALLEQQILTPGLIDRVIDIRTNQFGGPILNVRSSIQGPTGLTARLLSSWEVTIRCLRLVTAWVELDRPI